MPGQKGNENSRKHGLYQLDRVRRGVGAPLDRRTREARIISHRKNQVAADLGYRDFAEAPAILQDVIAGAVFCALQLELIGSIPAAERTQRMKEDYREWYKVVLKSATILGIRRSARDLTPTLEEIRAGLGGDDEGG